jgi:hypothetical protein
MAKNIFRKWIAEDLLDENIAIEDMVYPIIHLKVMILKWP